MENYPGFPEVIGGRELTERFRRHAEAMGARIERAEAVSFAEEEGGYVVRHEGRAARSRARSLILAPGCEPRRLGIPGEKELTGSGVSYCATCDAELYEEARVVVVGSGDTAVEEAGFISRFASEVVMIVVHDEGTLDCNRTQAEAAHGQPEADVDVEPLDRRRSRASGAVTRRAACGTSAPGPRRRCPATGCSCSWARFPRPRSSATSSR